MKKTYTVLILSLVAGEIFAQEAVSSNGGSKTTPEFQIDWSIGADIVTSTLKNGSNAVTQGIQQPNITVSEPILVGSILPYSPSVYPNLTSGAVTVFAEPEQALILSYTLLTDLGQIVQQANSLPSQIEMNSLCNGTYILRIFNSQQQSNTYKIIKQ